MYVVIWRNLLYACLLLAICVWEGQSDQFTNFKGKSTIWQASTGKSTILSAFEHGILDAIFFWVCIVFELVMAQVMLEEIERGELPIRTYKEGRRIFIKPQFVTSKRSVDQTCSRCNAHVIFSEQLDSFPEDVVHCLVCCRADETQIVNASQLVLCLPLTKYAWIPRQNGTETSPCFPGASRTSELEECMRPWTTLSGVSQAR